MILLESEKALAACFTLVRSKGKKDGKFAYTLVPDKCKNASTNLITELEEIGIHLENQFVFAKKKAKRSLEFEEYGKINGPYQC